MASQVSNNHIIFSLCKVNDLEQVKFLIQSGQVDKELVDSHGNSLLYYACLCGSLPIVHYLCAIGVKDDKYHRSYWNALSLEVRRVLKLYNNYKIADNENGKKQSQMPEEDLSLQSRLDRYVKRIIHQSQNNEDYDMILKLSFKDEKNPIEYKCHSWIILSRWPEIVYFVNNKIELKDYPTFSYSHYVQSLKSNKKIEEETKWKYSNQTPKQLYTSLKKEKQNHQKLKEDYSCFKIENTLRDFITCLPTELNQLKEYWETNLKLIDFGAIPDTRASFEDLLIWIYTGRTSNMSMMSLALRFKIPSLFKILLGQSTCTLSKDLSMLPIFQPIENMSAIEKLRRLTCDMGVTSINFENPNENVLPCHKQFTMDRSLFFEVIINCQFEEGNKFREQESNQELPIVELHQCSSKNILFSILNYIYCEEIELEIENLIEFLTLGELFGLPKLVQQCDKFLFETNLSKCELIDFYKYALSCDRQTWLSHLENKTLELIGKECSEQTMNADEIYEELIGLGADMEKLCRYIGQFCK